MINRLVVICLCVVLTLTACVPGTPPPYPAVEPTIAIPSPTPDLSAYYGNRPPAAVLVVGEQEQTAAIGTSTWVVEKHGDEQQIIHGDAFALVTPAEPLVVSSPFTAWLRLPIPAAPEKLMYRITPASKEQRLETASGDSISWQVAIEQPGDSLRLEQEQDIPFSLEAGQYLLEVYAVWEGLGSVDYGFYLLIEADGEVTQTYTARMVSIA